MKETIFLGSLFIITRKTVVFGVVIPEPYVQHAQLKKYKRQDGLWVGSIGGIFVMLHIILMVSFFNENIYAFLSFLMQLIMLIFSSAMYMIYHVITKKFKRLENWDAQVKTVYVTDLSLREKDESLPLIFFTIPIIVTLALITFTYMKYDSIPDRFATHWNIAGEIDDWMQKTWLSVIALPLVLLGTQISFLILGKGIKSAKIQLSSQDKEASVKRERYIRKYSSWYFAACNFNDSISFSSIRGGFR